MSRTRFSVSFPFSLSRGAGAGNQSPTRLRRALARERRRSLHAQRLLHALRAQLAEQRKLAAIVAHDLRSPLHAVNVALSLLEPDCPADTLKPLRLARASLARAGTLINDLLELTMSGERAPVHRPTRVQLGELAVNATDEARLRFPQRTLLLSQLVGPLWVDVDASQMAQVLDNLISNALLHSPPSASVAVQVCCQGSDACVVVENDGMVAPEVRARLFAPMNRGQTSSHRGSVGLGLHIAKRLVDAQGGRIELECHDSRTRFRVLLPCAASHAAEDSAHT